MDEIDQWAVWERSAGGKGSVTVHTLAEWGPVDAEKWARGRAAEINDAGGYAEVRRRTLSYTAGPWELEPEQPEAADAG